MLACTPASDSLRWRSRKPTSLLVGESPRDDHLAPRAHEQLPQILHRDVDAGSEAVQERDEPPAVRAGEVEQRRLVVGHAHAHDVPRTPVPHDAPPVAPHDDVSIGAPSNSGGASAACGGFGLSMLFMVHEPPLPNTVGRSAGRIDAASQVANTSTSTARFLWGGVGLVIRGRRARRSCRAPAVQQRRGTGQTSETLGDSRATTPALGRELGKVGRRADALPRPARTRARHDPLRRCERHRRTPCERRSAAVRRSAASASTRAAS